MDLISNLLKKDKTKRLGFKNDAVEILEHPFFEGVDTNAIMKREVVPKFKPVINTAATL